jgi:hypothetical protein
MSVGKKIILVLPIKGIPRGQSSLKNVNNCWNNNIYCDLETSGGKISNLYLNVVHYFNTSVNSASVVA